MWILNTQVLKTHVVYEVYRISMHFLLCIFFFAILSLRIQQFQLPVLLAAVWWSLFIIFYSIIYIYQILTAMSLISSSTTIIELHSGMNLQHTLNLNFGKLIVVVFYAQWNKQSVQFKTRFLSSIQLFGQFDNVAYIIASAEDYPQIFKQFSVQYVPTVIFTDPLANIIRKFQTQDEAIILDTLPEQSESYRISFKKQTKHWFSKIESITKQSLVVIFTTSNPSNTNKQTQRLLSLMNTYQIQFNVYNVREDRKMVEWFKHYSGNQAFPQLFVLGKFVGNTEKCFQLQQKGQFLCKIPRQNLPINAKERFEHLIKDHKAIIFTDKLSYQNTQQQLLISKLKIPSSQISIFNLTINNELKQFLLKTYQVKLPVAFVEGQLQQ